jgi:uncharacterized protein DUF2336
MTTHPFFAGFDGLMSLSRREGVDIRPTLLRVLTDLYVQTSVHSSEEERHFIELASRLIDEVDDATRAAVRARLAVYPATPTEVLGKLGLKPSSPDQPIWPAPEIVASSQQRAVNAPTPSSNLSLQPNDAAELSDRFFAAPTSERGLILQNLEKAPLQASARIPAARARRAIETLEMAAFAADAENFTLELGEALILPPRIAAQIADDPGGEPLACAMKALEMPSPVFQRVLLFLKAEFGSSVQTVYRLSRLYDGLSERSSLIMLAAWRGSIMAARRAAHRPTLYEDERHRARATPGQTRSPAQPTNIGIKRTGS